MKRILLAGFCLMLPAAYGCQSNEVPESSLLSADDLVEAFGALCDGPLELDAFKLPHHGSRGNVTRELIQSVDCPLWIFSTDGTQFRHPHKQAVARVILHGGERHLGFEIHDHTLSEHGTVHFPIRNTRHGEQWVVSYKCNKLKLYSADLIGL